MFFKNKYFIGYFTTIFVGLSSLPNMSHAYEKDKTYHLTILHTNDHHASAWESRAGGIAARMTLIESIKQEVLNRGGDVILLDAGDINTGNARSEVLLAEPDIKGMNLMGYDAMAVGDHEFDNPRTVLKQQESWAKFPFLSANIYEKGTENRLFKPYTMLSKSDLNIAVIGLSTEDITRFNYIAHRDNLEVRSPVDETLKAIKELHQTQLPDITIGLTHLGYDKTVKSTSKASGDVTLANALPTGTFNLIIGGHSHHAICMPASNQDIQADNLDLSNCLPDFQNGTWIMQAGESGEYVGRADLEFLNGQVKLVNYELIPVNIVYMNIGPDDGIYTETIGTPISPSEAMLDLLKSYEQTAEDKITNDEIGFVDKRLSTTIVSYGEKYENKKTRLYGLLMAAMIEKTGADLAIIGAESTSESIASGKISYSHIIDSLQLNPNGRGHIVDKREQQVVFIDFTGKELKNYLQEMHNQSFQANVTYDVNHDLTLSNIKIKNVPLDENKTYRLTTLTFYAQGLFGYPKIEDHANFIETHLLSSYVLKDYIKKHTPIKADDYRPSLTTYSKE